MFTSQLQKQNHAFSQAKNVIIEVFNWKLHKWKQISITKEKQIWQTNLKYNAQNIS